MLDLSDPKWNELTHAYGYASDIPALLRQLETNPNVAETQGNETIEPWDSLYSALCHQGSTYSASYAAVPHIVRIASLASDPIVSDYFCFPACIEQGRTLPYADIMPEELSEAYFEAIHNLPSLIPRIALAEWSEQTTRSILSALAGLKGHTDLANVIDMMDRDEIEAYYTIKDNE